MKERHSPLLEQRVLGALIQNGNPKDAKMQQNFLKLDGDCFYLPENRQIYDAIREQYDNKSNFDLVSLLDCVKMDTHLNDYLSHLITDQFYTQNFLNTDIEQLTTLKNLRERVKFARSAIISSEQVQSHREALENLTTGLKMALRTDGVSKQDGYSLERITDDYLQGVYAPARLLQTGNKSFDAVCAGIQAKSMVTIAAGSGVGKSFFGIYLMQCLARQEPDRQSLYFDFEMEPFVIFKRLIAQLTKTPHDQITRAHVEQHAHELLKIKCTIYDNTNTTIDYIETQAHLKALEQPLSVVVVDYLTLVQNHKSFERNDLRQQDICQRLAALAIKLDCIVLALSQTNRKPSERAKDDRCPYPWDAADSSGSERSSSLWLGLDRPELHYDEGKYKNLFVIKSRKNRHGNNFAVALPFNGGVFGELDKPYNFALEEKKPFQARFNPG